MTSRLFKSGCASSPIYFDDGSVQVVKNLRSMEDCAVTVKGIFIYKTPLQQGQGNARASPLQGLGAVIMHHFLVVEVSALSHPTQGQRKSGFLIRAEKAGPDKNGINTGITVRDVHFVEEKSFEEKYWVGDLNVSIPMKKLLHILTNHCADYDLLTDNCWRYADATCRALLEAFKELRPQDSTVLDRHLQQIPTLVMPVDTVAKVAGYGLLAATAYFATGYVYNWLRHREEEEDDEINGEKPHQLV